MIFKIDLPCIHVWPMTLDQVLDSHGQINKSDHAIMWLHSSCKPRKNNSDLLTAVSVKWSFSEYCFLYLVTFLSITSACLFQNVAYKIISILLVHRCILRRNCQVLLGILMRLIILVSWIHCSTHILLFSYCSFSLSNFLLKCKLLHYRAFIEGCWNRWRGFDWHSVYS